jgi:protoheme IX farnesyltransferase
VSSSSQPLGSRAVTDDTIRGVKPSITVGETRPAPKVSRFEDYSLLFKTRVTTLVVLCAWAGYFLAARKHGLPQLTWHTLLVLLGIGTVSAGAAAANEAWEWDSDGLMLRTKNRPLPAKRMSVTQAWIIAAVASVGGSIFLALYANLLTGVLALGTTLAYVLAYTPLKKLSTASTFVGAIPGAMPPVLGWTAVSNRLDPEAFALFLIMFCWQFPHFLAIAWIYREDYERAGIKMTPVLDHTGAHTIAQIIGYGIALLPLSLIPVLLHMGGTIYMVGAAVLGIAYLWFGVRLAMLHLPPHSASSKKYARHLLQASVIYLPLLFILMISNAAR